VDRGSGKKESENAKVGSVLLRCRFAFLSYPNQLPIERQFPKLVSQRCTAAISPAGSQFFILALEKVFLCPSAPHHFSSITFTNAISTLFLIAFSILAHLKNPR
jgi:hypothetical protein